MSVHFEDTDPRPRDEGRGVSPGFSRQRAERQRAADEAGKPDRVAELGRGIASIFGGAVTLWMDAAYARRLDDAARLDAWRTMIRKAGFEGRAYLPIPVRDEMRDLIGIELHPIDGAAR